MSRARVEDDSRANDERLVALICCLIERALDLA